VKVLTIGVYGWNAGTFFAALEAARADALIDVRRRRAVRGPHYAFANAVRLTKALDERGIAYLHELELAPDAAMLDLQHAADAKAGQRYSERTALAPEYLRRYRRVLERYDFGALARRLDGYRAPVLLCVERIPEACHRGLVAPRLAEALGVRTVKHLLPENA
jgi:uncharacterized protein (DUF488 family)